MALASLNMVILVPENEWVTTSWLTPKLILGPVLVTLLLLSALPPQLLLIPQHFLTLLHILTHLPMVSSKKAARNWGL